jgi:hypothetical protein
MGLRYGLRRGLTAWAAWVNAARSRYAHARQNGGSSGKVCRPRRRVRRQALMVCSRSTTATGGASSATCRVPWSSRQEALGGYPWGRLEVAVVGAARCSRRNSSSVWGPSGTTVRARLVLGGGIDSSGGGGGRVKTVPCSASTGWVVRTLPVGSVQVAMPSGVRVTCQPRRCLTRWCLRHRQSRLSWVVRPACHGRTWSRSQNTARRCSRGTGSAGPGRGSALPSWPTAGTRHCRTRQQLRPGPRRDRSGRHSRRGRLPSCLPLMLWRSRCPGPRPPGGGSAPLSSWCPLLRGRQRRRQAALRSPGDRVRPPERRRTLP